MPTNVPQPTFGPNGFQIPAQSAILNGVLQDLNQAFGGNLNTALTTPQGQLASSMASIIGDVNATFLFYTQQVDPAFSVGRMQDAIARIYFLTRIPPAFTTIQVSCSGLTGTVIPIGVSVIDAAKNIYTSTGSGVIGASGTVGISFQAQNLGPIPVPSLGAIQIYVSTAGWDSATVLSGVQGTNTESAASFEQRRQASVAINSQGQLASIRGAVLAVPGVSDAYVAENTSDNPQFVGGITLPAHCVYVAALGGGSVSVAQAIWTKKSPGAGYGPGNQIVTVLDQRQGYGPPFPSYQVTFNIPVFIPIVAVAAIINSPLVPANARTLVANAMANAFVGGDGGPRATIGSTIYAGRFFAPIQALGPWANVLTIQLGSQFAPVGSFTGSIANGTLTVSAVSLGSVTLSSFIKDNRGLIGPPSVLPGTVVTGQLTGPPGGAGTYSLGNLSGGVNVQTVPSQSMCCVFASPQSIAINIASMPTMSPDDINVVLS